MAAFTLPKFAPVHSSSITIFEKPFEKEEEKTDIALVTDMANIAWPGLLAAMSFYLTANLDEDLFQSTMRSYQNFTNVCGVLDLVTPRDAFLTNLCKNSIPIIPLLSSGIMSSSSGSKLNHNNSATSINTTTSLMTNASGNTTAVSFTDLPAQQQQAFANITLNDKNLYSLRVLLNIAMFLSSKLGSSWYLVLETLQITDFLLFNRPTPKGSSNPNTGSTGTTGSLRRTVTGTSISSGTMNPASLTGMHFFFSFAVIYCIY